MHEFDRSDPHGKLRIWVQTSGHTKEREKTNFQKLGLSHACICPYVHAHMRDINKSTVVCVCTCVFVFMCFLDILSLDECLMGEELRVSLSAVSVRLCFSLPGWPDPP